MQSASLSGCQRMCFRPYGIFQTLRSITMITICHLRKLNCPSLPNAKKAKVLPFIPTDRHVQNVSVMVQCEECNLWRLLYSKRKLTLPEKPRCLVFMWSYTFHELDLPDRLRRVHVLQHNCYDPVEPLYYAAGFDPICVYCASEVQDFEYL